MSVFSAVYRFASASRVQLPVAAFLLFLNMAVAMGSLTAPAAAAGGALAVMIQLAYMLDRRFAQTEDSVNVPAGELSVSPAPPAFFAALLLADALYLLLLTPFRPLLALAVVFVPLYTVPVNGVTLIKRVPALKTMVNLSAFWGVGVLAPFLLDHAFSWAAMAALLRATWTLVPLILAVSVLLDMRDYRGDAEAGVRSVPVLLGLRATAAALALLLAPVLVRHLILGEKADSVWTLWTIGAAAAASFHPPRWFYELFLLSANLMLLAGLAARMAS